MARRLYPLMLDITNRHVVVVGGGEVAERKVANLLECQAQVCLVAPEATDYLQRMAEKRHIEWLRREFHAGDIAKAFLVFAATNDRAVNQRVAQACDYEGILFSSADAPEGSEFILPAVLRRGRLTIAVSTDGGSPTLAQRIRDRIGEQFGQEYGEYVALLEKARLRVLREIEDPRRRREILATLSDDEQILQMVTQKNEAGAEKRVEAILHSSASA